jgi:HK97 family phage major capsid protein
MSYFDQKALLEERKKIVDEFQGIAILAKQENRTMHAEEQERFNRLLKLADEKKAQIESARMVEMAENYETRIDLGFAPAVKSPYFNPGLITQEERTNALRGWLIANSKEQQRQRPEFEDAMEKTGIKANLGIQQFQFGNAPPDLWKRMQEQRTGMKEVTWPQGGSSDTTGGSLVQQSQLIHEIDVQLKYYNNFRDVCKVYRSDTGEMAYIPTIDDVSNVASVQTELGAVTETDVAVNQVSLQCYTYDTGIFPISVQLIEDSRFNLLELLAELVGIRIGRKESLDMSTGASGGSQPEGIKTQLVAAGGSNVFTTASSGTITYNDLVNFKYQLDRAYRDEPGAAIMASDSFISYVWGLVDSQNRPLMNMSMSLIDPVDRVLGVPMVCNNNLDTVSAGNYPAIYGAWSHCWVRDVGNLNLRTLTEYYLEPNLGIGLLAWKRTGFNCSMLPAFVALEVHS